MYILVGDVNIRIQYLIERRRNKERKEKKKLIVKKNIIILKLTNHPQSIELKFKYAYYKREHRLFIDSYGGYLSH